MSLLNSLFSIINEGDVNDSNYIIAHYFLEHYHELDRLNLHAVAEACFVSRSSIRRFCRSIGFENFLSLKSEFSTYDDSLQAHMKFAEKENFRRTLTEGPVDFKRRLTTSILWGRLFLLCSNWLPDEARIH